MKFTLTILLLSSFFALNAQDQSNTGQPESSASEVKKEEVFTKDETTKPTDEDTLVELGILVEYISVDHLKANQILGQFADTPNDADEMRDLLDEMISDGSAELVETSWVRARSGNRAVTSSVREYVYPSEYDPAEIPTYIGNSQVPQGEGEDHEFKHLTVANPTAFECRNTGITLEADPIISADRKTASINLAPEIVTRLEDRYYTREGFEDFGRGIEHIHSPTFYTIKDTTMVEVTPGKHTLLGVHTPHDDSKKRVFSILRADLIFIR